MDGDDGDAAVDDGDRCLGLPDLSRVKMDPRWMSCPSRSFPDVSFRQFMGVLYVVSTNQLHGVKLFKEAAEMATIRAQLYGRTNSVWSYSYPLDLLESSIVVGFLLELLVNSKLTIFLGFVSFWLRHDWSKNYVHCIHHLS